MLWLLAIDEKFDAVADKLTELEDKLISLENTANNQHTEIVQNKVGIQNHTSFGQQS